MDKSKHILSSQAAQILEQCREAATLSALAQAISATSKVSEHEITALLNIFADAGLLLSETTALSVLSGRVSSETDAAVTNSRAASSDAPAAVTETHTAVSEHTAARGTATTYSKTADTTPSQRANSNQITSIGMPTRNRPEHLEAALRSYLECARKFGRNVSVTVADSSDTPKMQQSNRERLTEIVKEFGTQVSYIGLRERQQFGETLIKGGISPDAINFAISNEFKCSTDIGTNRNLLLFNSIGEITTQVDDDERCQMFACPDYEDGLFLTSVNNPTEFWFESETQKLESIASPVEVDYFAMHEKLLGRTLSECIDDFQEVSVSQIEARFFQLANHGKTKVRITAPGIFGDSGMTTTSSFFVIGDNSRKRLVNSEHAYKHTLKWHQLIRSAKRFVIVNDAYCMAANLGLDHREMLPPFMPVQRNEDGAFATLMRSCGFSGYFGFAPFAAEHRRNDQRMRDQSGLTTPPNMMLGDFIQPLLSTFTPVATASVENNLKSLGMLLESWGRASSSDFEELVRITMWRQATVRVTLLERHLETAGHQPEFWAKDVETYLRAYKRRISARDYSCFADLATTYGADRALEIAQQIVSRLGALLKEWSYIWRLANQLKEEGKIGVKL